MSDTEKRAAGAADVDRALGEFKRTSEAEDTQVALAVMRLSATKLRESVERRLKSLLVGGYVPLEE